MLSDIIAGNVQPLKVPSAGAYSGSNGYYTIPFDDDIGVLGPGAESGSRIEVWNDAEGNFVAPAVPGISNK